MKPNAIDDELQVNQYQQLLEQIAESYNQGRAQAVQAVNSQLLRTYWQIGQYIVEFEQEGDPRPQYGKQLLQRLSKDLKARLGKGFSQSNLSRSRQFYLYYPNYATLSHNLSWSHLVELLKIEDALERSFYEQQTVAEKWSVRELRRQKEAALFLRLAAGKNKDEVLQLARQGQIVAQPEDILRDPYVFEFLKIPEPYLPSERQLETALCDHLQQFLLELGKGFAFIGR